MSERVSPVLPGQSAPSSARERLQRVAIIGGGISGLAAAYRLHEQAPELELRVFEAGPQLGGVLETEYHDPYQVELGSDSFITNKPEAVELCRKLGMTEELVTTDDRYRKTFIVHRGRLVEVPEGFLLMSPSRLWPVVTTPILSPLGKLRLAWEYFVPKKSPPGDESLAAFVRRRLGRETYERLVQPLVGGIYTADGEKLSLQATLPRFLDWEQTHGGLIRASLRQPSEQQHKTNSGARYSLFVTPRRGLSSLIQAIAEALPAGTVQTNASIQRVARHDDGTWHLQRADGSSEAFDAVVVATPAPQAADLLQSVDDSLAAHLRDIPYAGAAIVTVAYDRSQIAHPLNGFGFVVPEVENRRILAASFSSIKFPGRAPDGKVLIRVFVGGAKRPEMLRRTDDELRQIVDEELSDLLGITGEPEFCRVGRYAGKMPQYHLGHVELVDAIEEQTARWPGLALAGNAYRGVGIPDCIASGNRAADRLLKLAPQQ